MEHHWSILWSLCAGCTSLPQPNTWARFGFAAKTQGEVEEDEGVGSLRWRQEVWEVCAVGSSASSFCGSKMFNTTRLYRSTRLNETARALGQVKRCPLEEFLQIAGCGSQKEDQGRYVAMVNALDFLFCFLVEVFFLGCSWGFRQASNRIILMGFYIGLVSKQSPCHIQSTSEPKSLNNYQNWAVKEEWLGSSMELLRGGLYFPVCQKKP